MGKEAEVEKETGDDSKRERSLKPEKDDLTDYQLLNSSGGAGVRGQAEATVSNEPAETEARATTRDAASAPRAGAADYNDNVDVAPIDTHGETNS
jgi:hypothetical protein